MNKQTPFMIHFQGASFSNNLYNARGEYIYTLTEAIEAASEQFQYSSWEVYNGQEAYQHNWEN